MRTQFMEDDLLNIFILISTVLGILLTVSELLAASSCKSNSIWEVMCRDEESNEEE